MKFSDSSYTILKTYFEEILVTRIGTDNSYLIGPESGLVSEGGRDTQLYELNPTQGFIGHNFQVVSVTDNNFIFEYIGELSSNSLSQELEINNEMYFRKDSFFHYWLNVNSSLYSNDVNVNKTFLYFGKIYPTPGDNNYYNIIFDGLKDFVYNALPENNRSSNIEEWIKIYWDESYHSVYNLMKTMWSMIDAKEVNLDFLGYISDAFGIAINEDLLTEAELREWVQNIVYFLKRKGTFSSYFIIWKLLLGNVTNQLNIYEQWQEWCSTEITDVPDGWLIDHHYLEYYGVSPSGSAGDYFYSQYNSDDYPIHANIAPTGACVENIWNCDNALNYSTFGISDLSEIVDVYSDRLFIENFDENLYSMYLIDSISVSAAEDIQHCVTTSMNATASPSASVAIWGLSNEVDTFPNHTGNYLGVFYEYSDTRKFKVVENYGGSSYTAESIGTYIGDKDYYVSINRNTVAPSGALICKIYNRERRGASDLIETINLPLHELLSYTQIYGLNYEELSVPSGLWTGDISELHTQSISSETVSPATSGNFILSPHYRVEIDLTGQPLGDTYIITEELINELMRYWEYTRPINKFVDYNYLIAPFSQMDEAGSIVSTYTSEYNGYLNTVFTGTFFTSAASAAAADDNDIYIGNTYTHIQKFATSSWKINHSLGTSDLLIQCFDENNILLNPSDIEIQPDISPNSIDLIFNDAVKGRAYIAAKDYIETITLPSNEWDIIHSLGTSGEIAPVVQIWDKTDSENQPSPPPSPLYSTRNKMYPSEIFDINLDQFEADFGDYTLQTSAGASATNYSYEISAAGFATVRRGSQLYTQSTPSDTWNITHDLNALGVITQVFSGNQVIKPSDVTLKTFDTMTITFSEEITGYAHLIKFPRTIETGSIEDDDPTGLGILSSYSEGYWEVGDTYLEGYDYTTNNRLINKTATGNILSIIESGEYYYIDFIIPKGEDLNIKEIGIFNDESNMMFYSFMSPMFKPENFEIKCHYRVEKPKI